MDSVEEGASVLAQLLDCVVAHLASDRIVLAPPEVPVGVGPRGSAAGKGGGPEGGRALLPLLAPGWCALVPGEGVGFLQSGCPHAVGPYSSPSRVMLICGSQWQ